MKELAFNQVLDGKEKHAWEGHNGFTYRFLANKRDDYYTHLVTILLQNYHLLGCKVSLTIHFLHSYFDFSYLVEELSETSIEKNFFRILLQNSLTRGNLKRQ